MNDTQPRPGSVFMKYYLLSERHKNYETVSQFVVWELHSSLLCLISIDICGALSCDMCALKLNMTGVMKTNDTDIGVDRVKYYTVSIPKFIGRNRGELSP